jgi:heme-degrading monooxygenase HmoA
MFIRATRLQTPADRVEAAIDNFKRETVPRLRAAPGNLGAVLLANRQTGAGIGLSYWESVRAMAAAEQLGMQSRTEAVKSVPGAQIVNVERYEVMIMDRSGQPRAGGFVRLNTLTGDIDKLDALTVFMRNNVLPLVRNLAGWRALIAGVDRQTGRSTVMTVWDSMDALEASDSKVAGLRAEAAKIAGAGQEGVTVEVFEGVVVELDAAVTAHVGT